MVGKTFKGLTDELLRWQTEALQAIAVGTEDGYVVHVRPELVVEIALDGVQASTRYPGGVALRFARVRGYRDDKSAAEADTIAPSRPCSADRSFRLSTRRSRRERLRQQSESGGTGVVAGVVVEPGGGPHVVGPVDDEIDRAHGIGAVGGEGHDPGPVARRPRLGVGGLPSANVVRQRYETSSGAPIRATTISGEPSTSLIDTVPTASPPLTSSSGETSLGVVVDTRPTSRRGSDGDGDHRCGTGEPRPPAPRRVPRLWSRRAPIESSQHLLVEAERRLHGRHGGEQRADRRCDLVVLAATRRTGQEVGGLSDRRSPATSPSTRATASTWPSDRSPPSSSRPSPTVTLPVLSPVLLLLAEPAQAGPDPRLRRAQRHAVCGLISSAVHPPNTASTTERACSGGSRATGTTPGLRRPPSSPIRPLRPSRPGPRAWPAAGGPARRRRRERTVGPARRRWRRCG